MKHRAFDLVVSTAALMFFIPSALSHSVQTDPQGSEKSLEGDPPRKNADQVASILPNAPPPVQSVVDRFKLWRTASTLSACFLNGDNALHGFFVEAAQTWLKRGALAIDFGRPPAYRVCSGPKDRTIRIAFGYQQESGGWDTGNWSYIGTDANTAPPGPTINIGFVANSKLDDVSQHELRRLILHELGHALALEHEHQNPLARCRFDWSKVIPYYQNHYGWDEKTIRFNLGKITPSPGLQMTKFDPHSIMNYSFPNWMFVQTDGPVCEIKAGHEPSQVDLETYSKLYPGKPNSQREFGQPTEQQNSDVEEDQQAQMLVNLASDVTSELAKLLPDERHRQLLADLINRIGREQFANFKLDFLNNNFSIGRISQKTVGNCSPAFAGVNGNVTYNANCTTNNSTIGTQNNVTGNQINNSGTLNNQGGINIESHPK